MICRKPIVAAIFLISYNSYAFDLSKTCSTMQCNVGENVFINAHKNDFYFGCRTKELSEYTNTLIAMMQMSMQFGGKVPSISQETGEPEYEGSSKTMLDTLRKNAKVNSFDDAVLMCFKGTKKQSVFVMNNPQSGASILVMDKEKKAFWLPKAFIVKKK